MLSLVVNKYPFFRSGDIVSARFLVYNRMRGFKGICISVSKKSLKDVNTTFLLRNVFAGVQIEQTIPLYGTIVFRIKLLKHERKKHSYKKSKLLYLRGKLNRESQVRSGLF